MKTNKQKEEFIQLRAENKSFDAISKELDVSKPVLIKWERELSAEIMNLKYLYFQSLVDKFEMTQKNQVEKLVRTQKKIWDELESRDFSDMTIKELLTIKEHTERELNMIKNKLKYDTGEKVVNNHILDDFISGEPLLLPLE